MAHGSFAQGNRLDGEVGYGLPVGSRFVGTPRVGFSTSEYGRDYRVGYGLGVLDRQSLNLELGVDAHRRESPMLDGTDNGFLAGPRWAGSRVLRDAPQDGRSAKQKATCGASSTWRTGTTSMTRET